MTLKEYLLRLVDNIFLLEKLKEYWSARRALKALKEWQSDPSTARPWREVFAETGVDATEEKSLVSLASSPEKNSEEDSGETQHVAQCLASPEDIFGAVQCNRIPITHHAQQEAQLAKLTL